MSVRVRIELYMIIVIQFFRLRNSVFALVSCFPIPPSFLRFWLVVSWLSSLVLPWFLISEFFDFLACGLFGLFASASFFGLADSGLFAFLASGLFGFFTFTILVFFPSLP